MLTINDVQNILSFALESVVVLSVFYFTAMLFISYPDWSKRRLASAEEKHVIQAEAAAQLELEPVEVCSHEDASDQTSMSPKKSKKGEKEHPKQKKAAEKKSGAVKQNSHVNLNGENVRIYQLHGQSVVKIESLPFPIPETVKTYQLRGKPAIKLLIAQQIANQSKAVSEVKQAA